MHLLRLRRLLPALPRLRPLAHPGGRGMAAGPGPPSRAPAAPGGRVREEDGEDRGEDGEDEAFGALGARFSARRLFRKATPALHDLRLRDRGLGREEEDEDQAGPEPAAPWGRRNTPYWYFLRCKRLIQEGKLPEALELFEGQMLGAERLRPEPYNYSVLIGGLGRAGQLKKAFRLFNDMKKRGLEPTDATYTGLFNACAECPHADAGLRAAEALRRQLRGRGLEPRTFHALLKAAARTSGLPLCLDVLKEMVQQGHSVTEETFCLLFMGCLRDREAGFRRALQLWRHMLGLGLAPSLHGYNLLLTAARDCGLGDPGVTPGVLAPDGTLDGTPDGGRPRPRFPRPGGTRTRGARPWGWVEALERELLGDLDVTPDVTPPDVLWAAARAPVGPLDVTPDVSPALTPDVTPIVPLDVTPDLTPPVPPAMTPIVTPVSPIVPPDVTPIVPLDVTPDLTPRVPPDVAPPVPLDVTPDVTPSNPLDVTSCVTPDVTPIVPLDVIPDLTPPVPPAVTPAVAPPVPPDVAPARTPAERLALLGGPAGVLGALARGGLRPDVRTLTLLAELCEPGFEPTLLGLLDGADADLAFFNALVRKRGRRGDLDGARALLPLLARKGLTPDMRTFCGLAAGCRRARDGLQLLEDLRRAGVTPSVHVYSALVQAAVRRLDYAYLIRVLRDLRRAGVAVTEVLLRQLEFAARYPPSFDRYRGKNTYLEKIDGFRAYYGRWLRAVPARETEGPGGRGAARRGEGAPLDGPAPAPRGQ